MVPGVPGHHGPQVVSFSPVIGDDDYDGVVVLTDLLEIIEYPPDLITAAARTLPTTVHVPALRSTLRACFRFDVVLIYFSSSVPSDLMFLRLNCFYFLGNRNVSCTRPP